jgi:hypothetical protein
VEVVSIQVSQGRDSALAYLIGLADDHPAGFDSLKLLFDLRCFKIDQHAPRILGPASTQYEQAGGTRKSERKTPMRKPKTA